MGRWVALALGVLAALAGVRTATAAVNFLVSGQTSIIIIDGNGDGPGPGDCVFTATVDPPSFTFTTFAITSNQDGTTPLRGCGGLTTGTLLIGSDSSSDFVDASPTATSLPAASGSSPPLSSMFANGVLIDAYEEFPSDVSPNGRPIAINTIDVKEPGPDGALHVGVNICSSGGPAAVVRIGGIPVLLKGSLYPDAQNPTHVKIPNFPFEKASLGSFALLDAYVPVTNRAITMSYGDPPDLLVKVDLDKLAACGGSVPTLTGWGVIVCALALLALGVWRLVRRPARAVV